LCFGSPETRNLHTKHRCKLGRYPMLCRHGCTNDARKATPRVCCAEHATRARHMRMRLDVTVARSAP
jgi:hypothetical protein